MSDPKRTAALADHVCPECGCECEAAVAEIARLRRIEEAARVLLAFHDDGHFEGWFGAKADDPVDALRAALEEKP